MKLEMKDPGTGKQVAIELPDWKILTGLMGATASFRSLASVHVLSAMLANPSYQPTAENGEEGSHAYARRAVDYADALLTELQKREVAAGVIDGKEQSP